MSRNYGALPRIPTDHREFREMAPGGGRPKKEAGRSRSTARRPTPEPQPTPPGHASRPCASVNVGEQRPQGAPSGTGENPSSALPAHELLLGDLEGTGEPAHRDRVRPLLEILQGAQAGVMHPADLVQPPEAPLALDPEPPQVAQRPSPLARASDGTHGHHYTNEPEPFRTRPKSPLRARPPRLISLLTIANNR